MIRFILFFTPAVIASLFFMKRAGKPTREIVIFLCLALIGFADWISILLNHRFIPTKLIGLIVDFVLFWR
ncbi:hypothetical protein [Paenibacillus sp. NPDC058071]|uniref:hypothetical protein n=1 Tax=Paenibacillus sp. NPDC058071 TaxID=3346326 RepID=UPI0036DE39B7